MTIANVTQTNTTQIFRAPGSTTGWSGDEPRQASASAGRRVEDRVEISPEARLKAVGLKYLESLITDPQVLREKSSAFQSELGIRMRMAGVDTTQPIKLITDSGGNVRVANNHPDKDKIEALFAEDADLSNRFRHLSVSANLQRAIKDHIEFAEAYAQDPNADLARYGHLFSGDKREMEFSFANGEWV